MWSVMSVGLLLLCSTAPELTSSARILGVFPHFGKSHFDFFEPLMKTLAQRGHEVVVVSHFPQAKPIANYSDISLKGCLPSMAKPVSAVSATEALIVRRFVCSIALSIGSLLLCHNALPHATMQDLIASDQHFDLVIYELFNNDCFLGLIHKFKAPSIAMSSCGLMPYHSDRFGNPDNPAYIPIQFEPSSVRMTFMERVFNTAHYIFSKVVFWILLEKPSEWIANAYYGDSFPGLSEIKKNSSVILVNSHFSFTKPRPNVPGVIEVAGLHVPPVKKLPKDIQEFMDGAKDGVIYFSMGSLIKADSMSDSRRQALVDAFAELPQRVLWKWDGDVLPGQPSNVKIAKWMPQFDILNHPNIRLYIGHGGQLGVVEAVHCGVPMIAIPMIGDQEGNVRHIEDAGMAIRLSYFWGLTKENVLNAIQTILTDPSYKENAKKLSQLYHDRPMSAMDTAVYWTEYVLRHQGALHLRSAAIDLNIFQYLLLDVIATLLAISSIAIFVMYKITSWILAMFRHTNVKSKQKLS